MSYHDIIGKNSAEAVDRFIVPNYPRCLDLLVEAHADPIRKADTGFLLSLIDQILDHEERRQSVLLAAEKDLADALKWGADGYACAVSRMHSACTILGWIEREVRNRGRIDLFSVFQLAREQMTDQVLLHLNFDQSSSPWSRAYEGDYARGRKLFMQDVLNDGFLAMFQKQKADAESAG